MLFDKLRQIEERSEELERALADPRIYGQPAEFARLRKEHADSSEIVDRFREYREVLRRLGEARHLLTDGGDRELAELAQLGQLTVAAVGQEDRKSTRLNSSHGYISYAVFCLKKKKN